MLDGKAVEAGEAFEQPAHKDSVIGVREGQAGVAIRVFRADGYAGQEPVFVLKGDKVGLANGVARLAVYHYQGTQRQLDDGRVRIGLMILAASCHNDREFAELLQRAQAARIEDKNGETTWAVGVRVGDLSLEARYNVQKQRIIDRRIDGRDVQGQILSVNGKDLAGPNLGSAGGPLKHSTLRWGVKKMATVTHSLLPFLEKLLKCWGRSGHPLPLAE